MFNNSTDQIKNSKADTIVQDMISKLRNGDNISPAQILQTAMNGSMLKRVGNRTSTCRKESKSCL